LGFENNEEIRYNEVKVSRPHQIGNNDFECNKPFSFSENGWNQLG
jgi:hypothetical protein